MDPTAQPAAKRDRAGTLRCLLLAVSSPSRLLRFRNPRSCRRAKPIQACLTPSGVSAQDAQCFIDTGALRFECVDNLTHDKPPFFKNSSCAISQSLERVFTAKLALPLASRTDSHRFFPLLSRNSRLARLFGPGTSRQLAGILSGGVVPHAAGASSVTMTWTNPGGGGEWGIIDIH